VPDRLRIDGKPIPNGADKTLFQQAESVGIHVPTSCREQGKCRECLVEIERGGDLLSPPTVAEEHLPDGFRLSCQARVSAPEGEVRCHTLRRGALKIEEQSSGLDSRRPEDDEPLFRRAEGFVQRDKQPFAEVSGPLHGLAIDLGTTTVVVRLVALDSGRAIATQSFENPQRFGGSDVMARIRYETDHPGGLLQRVLLGYLRRSIKALPCEPESILEIVVAGNPTMRDLLFGLDVRTIGQLPYRSITEHEVADGSRRSTGLEIAASRLRLPAHPEARLVGLPLLGSHVGADAAACLLATGLAERDEISMCVDIGTNTEVLIGNRERVLAASCPAGPAFEGGGVRCGVPGLEGAIEHLSIDSGGVRAQVIGDQAPIGICGSGLVDLLSELRRTSRMNAQGRLQNEDGFPSNEPFVIDDRHDIELTERDINELAQAKGANAAGARIVADRYGIDLDEIDRFYLAGGFGRHLDTAAARRIGLIPDLPDEKIVQVGNAPFAGPSPALVTRSARQRLDELEHRVEHVELELHPKFFDFFVDGCQFEPFGGSRQ
jgi:uncharacterized 2Fe-2S/4Fe-4S cluster protein (DUF4445 family)